MALKPCGYGMINDPITEGIECGGVGGGCGGGVEGVWGCGVWGCGGVWVWALWG